MGGVVVWRKSQLNNVKKDKTTPEMAMMIKKTLQTTTTKVKVSEILRHC